jgi:hypothetical protein
MANKYYICNKNLDPFFTNELITHKRLDIDNTDNAFVVYVTQQDNYNTYEYNYDTYYYDIYNEGTEILNPTKNNCTLVDNYTYNYNLTNTDPDFVYNKIQDSSILVGLVLSNILNVDCLFDTLPTSILFNIISFNNKTDSNPDPACLNIPENLVENITKFTSTYDYNNISSFINEIKELTKDNCIVCINAFYLDASGAIMTVTNSDDEDCLYMRKINLLCQSLCEYLVTSPCMIATTPDILNVIEDELKDDLEINDDTEYANFNKCSVLFLKTLIGDGVTQVP